MDVLPRAPRSILLALVTLLLALAAAPAAKADGLYDHLADGCPELPVSKPFLPWLDPAHYVPAPGGSFEVGAAKWELSRASRVAGNEPWYVRSRTDSGSLRIEAGGSATAPAVCMNVLRPTLRFFVRGSGALLSTLRVEALVGAPGVGLLDRVPIGVVSGLTPGWRPSLPMPIVKNLLALVSRDQLAVAFRFTASGGAFQIDDVYVDPYSKR